MKGMTDLGRSLVTVGGGFFHGLDRVLARDLEPHYLRRPLVRALDLLGDLLWVDLFTGTLESLSSNLGTVAIFCSEEASREINR